MGPGCSEARGGLLRSRKCSCVSLGSSGQRARRPLEKVARAVDVLVERAGRAHEAACGLLAGCPDLPKARGPHLGNSSVGGAMRFRGAGSEKPRSPGVGGNAPQPRRAPWAGEGQRDAPPAAPAAAAAPTEGPRQPRKRPRRRHRVNEPTPPTSCARRDARRENTALPTGLSFWSPVNPGTKPDPGLTQILFHPHYRGPKELKGCTAPLKLTMRKAHEEPACAHLDTL
eukprot:XP_022274874.1 uncharacterized protein LOC111096028 [Canis lupus familiaris]